VPELLYTRASRILIYAFGAFLVGDNPTLLRNGYSQSPPEALASLIQRIVGALASKQLYEHGADGPEAPWATSFSKPTAALHALRNAV
jgi:hypothetical protein